MTAQDLVEQGEQPALGAGEGGRRKTAFHGFAVASGTATSCGARGAIGKASGRVAAPPKSNLSSRPPGLRTRCASAGILGRSSARRWWNMSVESRRSKLPEAYGKSVPDPRSKRTARPARSALRRPRAGRAAWCGRSCCVLASRQDRGRRAPVTPRVAPAARRSPASGSSSPPRTPSPRGTSPP